MEYSRKHAKYIQKYPENKENVQKMSKNMSKKYQKNAKILGNLGQRRPNIKPHIWLPQKKCYSKNVRLGLKTLIMVSLWPENFSQPKFSDEPKNQQFHWLVL